MRPPRAPPYLSMPIVHRPSPAVRRATGLLLVGLVVLLAGLLPPLPHDASSTSPLRSVSGPLHPASIVRNYSVTFLESGLPNGSWWSLTVHFGPNVGSYSSSTSSLTASLGNGTYTYAVVPPSSWVASPSNGTLVVNGANLTLRLAFNQSESVRFVESGLASGSTWSVTWNGTTSNSSTTTIAFSAAAGRYTYTIGVVGGYSSNVTGGQILVAGAPTDVAVGFRPTPGSSYVNFSEGPVGVGAWSVSLAGVVRSAYAPVVVFVEPNNASYAFRIDPAGLLTYYSISPSSGSLRLNSSSVTVAVTILRRNFTMTFTESGLPSGTVWSVALGATPWQNATAPASIVLSAPAGGSYIYDVRSASTGFAPTAARGIVDLTGNMSVAISFVPTYWLTFQESGLPTGNASFWWVSLNVSSQNSSSSAIVFGVPNGSYAYTVGGPVGYFASPSSGTVRVAGANATLHVRFVPSNQNYSALFVEHGLPSGTNWSVTVGGWSSNSTRTLSSRNSSLRFTGLVGDQDFEVEQFNRSVPSYVPTPAYGSLRANGTNLTIGVTYTALYPVTFRESGLPNGTFWTIDVIGVAGVGTIAPTIGLDEPNGSYGFVASADVNGSGLNSSGSFTVGGAAVTVNVAFQVPAPPLVPLTFRSTGTAGGARWSVTLTATATGLQIDLLASSTHSAAGGSPILFHVTPGTYDYASSSPGSGPVGGSVAVIAGTDANVTLAFASAGPTPSRSALLGLPGWASWLGVALVAIGALGCLGTVVRLRARRRELGRAAARQMFATTWETGSDGEPEPGSPR